MTGKIVNLFGGPAENAGGSPTATTTVPARSVADELRELADRLDSGELPPAKQMICIPVDEDGVDTPYLLGPPMNSAEVIGRLEICKAAVLESMWVEFE